MGFADQNRRITNSFGGETRPKELKQWVFGTK